MTTLKGLFGDTKPKCRRNFIQENMRQLREMQDYLQSKEKQINSTTLKPTTNKYQNVPSRIGPRTSGSQPKSNEQKASKEKISRVTKSSSKPLASSSSNPVSHVTQVGITRKSRSPTQKINGPKKKDNPNKEDPCVEENASNSDTSPVHSGRMSRSLGCQTLDPRNTDDIYNEGVIRYPSSRKAPSPKKKQPVKKPPTREMGLQTERSPSSSSRNSAAGGDTPTSVGSRVPDLQKLSLSQHSSDVDEPSEVPETNYMKMDPKLTNLRPRSPAQPLNSILKPPPTYQKGVVPKYLRDRKEEWQKAAEQEIRDAPDPACPPGHVSLPDNERIETLKMLRKSYADLVQELNMMPVRTDTLRMRNRKMELEKQLNKIEQGIKVFSRPKVFVKIGA